MTDFLQIVRTWPCSGHDNQHVKNKFQEVAAMSRQEACKKKKNSKNLCIFSTKYNPREPDIRKI